MRAKDTSPEADEARFEAFRRMGGERRFEAAIRMSEDVRTILAEGVRSRHPDYDDERVRLATIGLMLGERLFRAAFGASIVEP